MWCLVDSLSRAIVWASKTKPRLNGESVLFDDANFPMFSSGNSEIVEINDISFKVGKWKLINGEPILNESFVEDVSAIKNNVWEQIKKHRDILIENGGFKVDGHWYHSNLLSRTQYLSLVLMGENIPPNTMWKTMENGYVTMTQSLANQIFAAGAIQDKMLFEKAAEHRVLLEASNDPSSYDWTTGWPETFME